jgi:diguanylate cyclase
MPADADTDADAPTDADADALQRLQGLLSQADPSRAANVNEAATAAAEAQSLAHALSRPADAGLAGAWLARHCLHQGRLREALDEATEASRLLTDEAPNPARIEAMRVAVLAASELGQFDRALEAAQVLMELTTDQAEAGPALGAAVALAVCFERMGDSWQAARLLSQALEEHGAHAPELALLSANNALCAVCTHVIQFLRDSAPDEEGAQMMARGREAGEQALRLLSASANPAHEVAVRSNLAETLIAQGDLEQATSLLQKAQACAREHGLGFFAWHADVNLADIRLRQGHPGEAQAMVARVLAEMGDDTPPATRAILHELSYRVCKAQGSHDEALQHLEHVRRIERGQLIRQLRVQSQLFVTRTEAQRAERRAEQARQEAQQQRERAAVFAADAENDPLTGLGNRRHLERRAAEFVPPLESGQRALALAQIDVDHFKQVNDRYGHAAGDAVLVRLAQILRESFRAADIVARTGGEEFLVVLPDAPAERAVEACERLRARVQAQPCVLPDGTSMEVTVSIGVAAAPPYELAHLMQQADEALYAAKRGGRNRVVRSGSPADSAP